MCVKRLGWKKWLPSVAVFWGVLSSTFRGFRPFACILRLRALQHTMDLPSWMAGWVRGSLIERRAISMHTPKNKSKNRYDNIPSLPPMKSLMYFLDTLRPNVPEPKFANT